MILASMDAAPTAMDFWSLVQNSGPVVVALVIMLVMLLVSWKYVGKPIVEAALQIATTTREASVLNHQAAAENRQAAIHNERSAELNRKSAATLDELSRRALSRPET